jgi:hypothetical protein
MKTISFVLLGLLMSFSISSCSNNDDDDGQNNGSTSGVVVDGTWKVTLFQEDNVNQTNHFNGYAFDFNSNGVLTATNDNHTQTGIWNNGGDDSGNKLNIDFLAAPDDSPFEEISEDWRIESKTTSKIELKHLSGGDGSIDLLTFEKL